MGLTVLSVAYPFARVGSDAVGGAEQVLGWLDQALVAAGHRSLVVACDGSRVQGTLLAVPQTVGGIDAAAHGRAHAAHRQAIANALARWPVDLVHLHGIDADAYLPPAGVPALVTLHMPASCYAQDLLHTARPQTWFNCVSAGQHATCGDGRLLAPIDNGVPTEALNVRHGKRDFALVLARICPEKGIHLAIEAAKRAGVGLIIAGTVYDYHEHRQYFDEEVRPRLDDRRRFIGPVDFRRKRRLLAAARCLIVASLAPETSSLAAREALAAGTPVVALARGALCETVEHGRTGFLVDDAADLPDAIAAAPGIDPETCRATAAARFALERMTDRYLAVYRQLAAGVAAAAA